MQRILHPYLQRSYNKEFNVVLISVIKALVAQLINRVISVPTV
jgi:hypothetical protein